MAKWKRAYAAPVVAIAMAALAGCAGTGGVTLWPFWAEGPAHEAGPTGTASSWVDATDAPAPPADEPAGAVRKASAEIPLDPPPIGDAKPGNEAIHADRLLQPGHVLR